MNALNSKLDVLSFAAKNDIPGVLVTRHHAGDQTRAYVINGKTYKVRAWETEHTLPEKFFSKLCGAPCEFIDSEGNEHTIAA